MARAEAIEGLKTRLEQNGSKLLDPPRESPADGLWFRDADDVLINVRAAEPAPWLPAPEWKINNPGHLKRRVD